MDEKITTNKYTKLMNYISTFQLKRVRFIMSNMRRKPDIDLFFPYCGCTAGEFACGYTMKKINNAKR